VKIPYGKYLDGTTLFIRFKEIENLNISLGMGEALFSSNF